MRNVPKESTDRMPKYAKITITQFNQIKETTRRDCRSAYSADLEVRKYYQARFAAFLCAGREALEIVHDPTPDKREYRRDRKHNPRATLPITLELPYP